MGWTSEMLAQDYNISREQMDELALISHTRASEAHTAGRFKDEIMPITTTVVNAESGESNTVEVKADDGLRHGTTIEGLKKLRSAFPDWGKAVSTGGNSSQVKRGVLIVSA